MAQSAALAGDDLDELESHLRDSVRDLQSLGLSDQEAFLIGARRVGDNQTLVAEFSKLQAGRVWIDRTLWMTVGLALFVTWSSLLSYVAVMESFRRPSLEAVIVLISWIALLRSMARGTGWTPRALNALVQTPFKLSAAIFCVGMCFVSFRAALGTIFFSSPAVMVNGMTQWIVLSLIVGVLARARVRRSTA